VSACRRLVAVLASAAVGVLVMAGTALAQVPKPAHAGDDLDCKNCHRGNHRGVVQMYVGMGGRGTPIIPSHMVQVRVECVACHTAPQADGGSPTIVGETFRPREQACVNCHGEKYRGMIAQWSATLTRMRELLAPKVAVARAALASADAKHPKVARARTLVDDADFNIRFVALAKGVHNVFYAADLLKLANGWLDEAPALLGKAPAKTDDQLVRGGYCAVLCHEAAGVKTKPVVTFAKRPLPHARHVTELGATCTSCHSPETHKAVTATPATCTSCHHSPQNERCESCHRAQTAFYRGQTPTAQVTLAPNVMADAVGCPGCHDFSRKHSREAVGRACVTCHEPRYTALLTEWTQGFDADVRATRAAVRGAESELARARRAGGRTLAQAEALVKQAQEALALVTAARPAHNPLAADALLITARTKAAEARSLALPGAPGR
jgi:hypothetical protein